MPDIKAIIFDVDGTLLDTERIYVQSWKTAGAARGYTVPDAVLQETRGVRTEEGMAMFCRYCGPDFPYAEIRRERIRISEELIARTPSSVLQKPGAEELLQWLKSQGYQLAASTSTDKQKTDTHLVQAQLLSYFDGIACGDMVTRGKPAPDIFLKAAELVEIPPEACLAVGDTPADAGAAAAAGMRFVLIPDLVPADPENRNQCWKCLEHLLQLQKLLETE